MVGPLTECGCAVKVAVVAERSVWHKPLLVVGEEALEVGLLCERGLFLCEYLTQVFHLCVVHPLVVNLRQ